MERDVFEILMENAVNERLDDILLENEEYSQIQEQNCKIKAVICLVRYSNEILK